MSILNIITLRFKQKDNRDTTSGNPFKHGGHLWCSGVRYQPRDVMALIMSENYYKQKINKLESLLPVVSVGKTVSFCMRCYSNSAVPVTNTTNFCHNCGSEGTCISITADEANYLRESIDSTFNNMYKAFTDAKKEGFIK